MNGNSKDAMKADILILAAARNLSPRVVLEKKTLEDIGYSVEVFYRDRISFSKYFFKSVLSYYWRSIRICSDKNITCIHLCHIGQLPMAPFFKLMGKKVIYDAFERFSVDISEQHAPRMFKEYVKWSIEIIENFLLKGFVDAVFVVSTPGEYLEKRYDRHCGHVEVLYNVPPIDYLFQGNVQKKFREKTLKLAYVGGINHAKGSELFVPLAIKLLKKNIGFRLHLIGRFSSEALKESLLDGIKRNGINQHIVLNGFMNYNQMSDYLKSFHVGLTLHSQLKRFSYIGKGSSRKNFTYMCAGMVVLTHNVGEMSKVVEEEKCGIVLRNTGNLNEVADAIERLEKDRRYAAGLAENGLNAIRLRYNWDKEKEKVVNRYNSLLSSKM